MDPEHEPNEALRRAGEVARELIVRRAEEIKAEDTPSYPDTEETYENDSDDDDDDSEVTRGEMFDVMSPTEFNAHRLDAWKMAYSALVGESWGGPGDEEKYFIDPADVLLLARFIEGDELNE